MPNTFPLALKRLESLEKKIWRDPEYAEEYRLKIDDYINKGYARKISEEETNVSNNNVFYLPHFGVKNPHKLGIRLVFDAAAETNNISLNKFLFTGPDLNQPLLTILFKFRQASIAVCGDIKEMFHQVEIRDEDKPSQRILWRVGGQHEPVELFQMNRMIFGAACSPTIAQYVKNKNAEKFKEKFPRAAEPIIERHYVKRLR